MALSKQIILIDNMDNNDYDLIFKSGIMFEIREDGNYCSDIMRLTNYIVKFTQKSIIQN